ncbi:MAG: nucleotidyltransferase [Anaerolineaceae bacterium]|nr:nucleotidyltransferase [Anaerolineaceae bacterium]
MIHPVETSIPLPYEAIAAFCQRHHIVRLWLFGSVLKETFSSDSDVDVLVEFDPDHMPGLNYFGMPDELSQILGRPVDFGTPDGLSPYIRDEVMQAAQVVYERA